MESQIPRPLAVTVKEGRRLSGLGNTKFYQLIKQKRIETIKVGRRRLVKYSSLERLINGETGSA